MFVFFALISTVADFRRSRPLVTGAGAGTDADLTATTSYRASDDGTLETASPPPTDVDLHAEDPELVLRPETAVIAPEIYHTSGTLYTHFVNYYIYENLIYLKYFTFYKPVRTIL